MLTKLPILSILIFMPAMMAITFLPFVYGRLIKCVALGIAVLELVLTLSISTTVDYASPAFQLIEFATWSADLNLHYKLGIDGISAFFPALTAFLIVSAIIATWTSVKEKLRLFYVMIFLLEGATLGVYLSLDLGLFFLFWELLLIPVYFLFSLWGIGPECRQAAIKYTLYMMLAGVPLLFGIILLALNHSEVSGLPDTVGVSLDYVTLMDTPMMANRQLLVFVLLFAAFAMKAPLVPFHSWLPSLSMESAPVLTALLTGLKLGVYGFIRILLPLLPHAVQNYAWLFLGLGTLSAVYAALLAMQQSNLRRLLAYASISHVSLIVAAIGALNLQALQGALFELTTLGLVSCGLFLMTGFLQHRFGTNEMHSLGGLAVSMPRFSAFFFLFLASMIAIPGTAGFAGESLLIVGMLKSHTGYGLAAIVLVVITTYYVLNGFRVSFLGPVTNPSILDVDDLKPRELLVLAPLLLIILLLGFMPNVLTDRSHVSIGSVLSHILQYENESPTSVALMPFFSPTIE